MPHRGSDQGEDGRGHGRWRSYSSKQITLIDPMLMFQHLLYTTTGDWCVLYQLGWIDENGKENNETSTADLMSLKPEVIKSGSTKCSLQFKYSSILCNNKPGSCGAGRVSNGNLRSGESGYDRQDDGEKAQEVSWST